MIICIILIVIFLVCLIVMRREKINLNDYLKVEIKGYDTIGMASFEIDYNKLQNDYKNVFEKNVSGEMKEWISFFGIEMLLSEAIDGELTMSQRISNGDTVTFLWDVNVDEIEEQFKVKFVYDNVETKVSSLEEGKLVDLFEELDVVFTGTTPNGKASIEETFSVPGLRVSLDKTSGLKNGDTVIATIKGENGKDVFEVCYENGIIPKEVEKKYIVKGLNSYLNDLNDLPNNALSSMDEQARDVLDTYIAETWNATTLLDMELVGQYLLYLKPGFSTSGDNNRLILVYKNTVENTESTFSYYYYTIFSNVIMDEKGEINSDLQNYTVPEEDGWFSEGTTFTRGGYYYTGYECIDEIYEELVRVYSAEYEADTNISEEYIKQCNQLFVEEKGNFYARYIRLGDNISELVEGTCYKDEVIEKAKRVAAEEYYKEKEYAKAYDLYVELNDVDKVKEVAECIYNELERMTIKGAFDTLSVLRDEDLVEEDREIIEQAYLSTQFKEAKVGDIILFGDYEQDGNNENGMEPIEWIVIDKNEKSVTLLSKYILEYLNYQDSADWSIATRWDVSTLRSFLNNDFLMTAFSEKEQLSIATEKVEAEVNPYADNSRYGKNVGENTEDKVYILSYNEYMEYKDVKGVKSYELVSRLDKIDDNRKWEMWLRTPSTYAENTMSVVYYDGRIGLYNAFAYIYAAANREHGVRPVISIDISK